MNLTVDKTKFWWGMIGLIVLVLAGVNIYLYWLRASIREFVRGEIQMDNRRIEQINEIRQYEDDNPQPKF